MVRDQERAWRLERRREQNGESDDDSSRTLAVPVVPLSLRLIGKKIWRDFQNGFIMMKFTCYDNSAVWDVGRFAVPALSD